MCCRQVFNLRATDDCGRTALHYCSDNNSSRIAAMILNQDFSLLELKDEQGCSALLLAVIAGNLCMVKFLLQQGADVQTRDLEDHTLVHWAVGESAYI